jgi:hypothetical protein
MAWIGCFATAAAADKPTCHTRDISHDLEDILNPSFPRDGNWEKTPVPKVRNFEFANRGRIAKTIEDKMKEKGYEFIFIVEFLPNDFGRLKEEAQTDHYKTTYPTGGTFFEKKKSKLPFDLLPDEVAYDYNLSNKNTPLLGNITYRYNHEEKGLKTVLRLFDASNPKNDLLSKTLFIGSGGSHGADAIRKFHRDFLRKTGRGLDLVFIGDGIKQPFSFPLRKFDKGPTVLNFYQKDTWYLHGRPLKNATNIFIQNTNHDIVAHDVFYLADLIDSYFDYKQNGSIEARLESASIPPVTNIYSDILAVTADRRHYILETGARAYEAALKSPDSKWRAAAALTTREMGYRLDLRPFLLDRDASVRRVAWNMVRQESADNQMKILNSLSEPEIQLTINEMSEALSLLSDEEVYQFFMKTFLKYPEVASLKSRLLETAALHGAPGIDFILEYAVKAPFPPDILFYEMLAAIQSEFPAETRDAYQEKVLNVFQQYLRAIDNVPADPNWSVLPARALFALGPYFIRHHHSAFQTAVYEEVEKRKAQLTPEMIQAMFDVASHGSDDQRSTLLKGGLHLLPLELQSQIQREIEKFLASSK